MASEIIINSSPQETRVALLENGVVAEIYIERRTDRSIVGNIYKGKVVRILPGMDAAFVDIGLSKAGFLYAGDIHEELEEYEFIAGEDMITEFPREERAGAPQIEDLLKEGQEILVQVAKEPIGGKGARLTSRITLPGRNLVFMPFVDHIGVSRRIENERERRRLREIIARIRPPETGFIVRTAGEGRDEADFHHDMEFLIRLWNNVQKRCETVPAPALVHEDLDLTLRAIRDLFTEDVTKVVVDSKGEYHRVIEFIEDFMPDLKRGVELYEGQEGIFEEYGVELEIARALGRKVWLKSGGYITIDQTEALTAIDVNTGRFVGRRRLEETLLKTNLEAVKEIACQLRLRNIGGIIIIDFIDMERESNREKLYSALIEALKKDRAKTNILKVSELGLIQMTRQRVRENLKEALCEPCPYCEGKGYVRSKQSICYDIFREIRGEAPSLPGTRVIVSTHPEVADLLYDEERAGIEELERRLNKRIIIKAKPQFHQEQFEITGG